MQCGDKGRSVFQRATEGIVRMRWSDLVEKIGTKMPDRLVRTQKRMLPNVPNQEKLVNGKEYLRA